jgi:YHS domain-containing protein
MQGVHMERDPVCGTFVVPHRAVSLIEGRRQIYFCSPRCRDAYRARIA